MTLPALRPLCDAGRCAQLLERFAEIRAKLPEQNAAHITEIMTLVLADYGLDFSDAGVRAKVLAATQQVTGVTVTDGVAA